MAQRFKSSGTGQAISVAGLTIPHGLGTTPDEVWAVITALGNVATANSCYMFSAADAIIAKGVSTPGEAEALLRFVEFTSGIGPDHAKALQAVRAYLRQ